MDQARIELSANGCWVPATLLSYGSEVAVTSPVPYPPGARLELATVASDGARSSFRLKSHRCKRQPEGHFIVVGATIDLRREGREVLEALGRSTPGLPKGV